MVRWSSRRLDPQCLQSKRNEATARFVLSVMKNHQLLAIAFAQGLAAISPLRAAAPPAVCEKMRDFRLARLDGRRIHLADPDLKTMLLYDLRWDALNDTAYPSTFVFDRQGVTRFYHSHGDRSTATEMLDLLRMLK